MYTLVIHYDHKFEIRQFSMNQDAAEEYERTAKLKQTVALFLYQPNGTAHKYSFFRT